MPLWRNTEKKLYYQLSSTLSSFFTQLRYIVRGQFTGKNSASAIIKNTKLSTKKNVIEFFAVPSITFT